MSDDDQRDGAGCAQLRRRVDRRAEPRLPLDVDGTPQVDVGGGVVERQQRVDDLRLGCTSRIAPDRILEEARERRDEVGRQRCEVGLARGAGRAGDDVMAAVGEHVADEGDGGLIVGPARGVGQCPQGRLDRVALHGRPLLQRLRCRRR
jgi:hypothetical protein